MSTISRFQNQSKVTAIYVNRIGILGHARNYEVRIEFEGGDEIVFHVAEEHWDEFKEKMREVIEK